MKKRLFLTLLAVMFMTLSASANTTPAPEITVDWNDYNNYDYDCIYDYDMITNYYDKVLVFDFIVTATGEGDVHLYLNGEEVSNPYIIVNQYDIVSPYGTGYLYNQLLGGEWQFTATAQVEGCEMSENVQKIVQLDIPSFSLSYDEESESFWMELHGYNDSRIWYMFDLDMEPWEYDWKYYSGPFKVWYAPQSLYCMNNRIEVMEMGDFPRINSNMGTIVSLRDEIKEFGIFEYDDYDAESGFYYHCGNSEEESGICNKYCDPQSHAPCYSGDLIVSYNIYKNTFANCPDLTSIVLQNLVSAIGSNAFAGCSGLKSITCESTTPPSTSNSFADESIFSQATLFVPLESLEAYKAHAEWGKFTRIVPFIGAGPGDLNGDGKLSINDVTGLIDMLLNDEELPAYCDVNGDGNITINDITALIDMVLNAD